MRYRGSEVLDGRSGRFEQSQRTGHTDCLFPDALRAVFPQTHVRLCIVHMPRNSVKYVSYKDFKAVYRDLKKIYRAVHEEEARYALDDFGKL